ncbi:MAG: hypothetical protein CVV02_15755 [Firmicutes bacterium HGW-Firmicutes-7]|nr:MAG: hypothetical protein CVV02_15755 [Firmicutes bacterium HGW-Firmicutes-7]
MYVKKIISVFLVSMFVLFTFTNCKAEKVPEGRIEAEIQFGYEGTVKISSGNPLVATIKNNGAAFEGELQIEIEDSMVSKVIVAQPFEIAQNATKEISIDVPVYIIQKDFTVNITSNKKKLFEDTVKATKILPPNRVVMAVVTDTPDAYRFLENTKLKSAYIDEYMYKYSSAQVTQEFATGELEDLEVLFFDSFDQIDSEDKLGFFNYVYIGHNQSLNISEDVERNLTKWMSTGNTLVIETGADYKKVNSILPESLRPVEIIGVENLQIENLWYNFSINQAIDIAKTNATTTTETEIIEVEGTQLGAKTIVGNGVIITLFVNMGLDPIASWNSKAPFIESILGTYSLNNNNQHYDPYYVSQFQYLVEQVPSEEPTPYLFMIVLLGIYIFLVAPIAYFVLKKLDKRDYAWIGIPALAAVCVVTMYVFGLGTKHNQAIMNSISVLSAKEEEPFMNITSDIMIFNNERDKLKIEWGNDENLKLNNQRDQYYRYQDPNDTNVKKTLNGKMTRGNTNIYEKYNAGLWGSTYISGDKKIPFEAKKMIKMQLNNDKVSFTVTNTTPYELESAFIKWGMGNIYVGDLEPGQEKTVEQELSKSLSTSFEIFLDQQMGLKRFDYSTSARPNKQDQIDMRTLEILLQRYVYNNYQYMPNAGLDNNIQEVKLCALNYQDVGYDIKVNDQGTENFLTNIIEITTEIEFDKGAEIKIPKGIIAPQVVYFLDDKFTTSGAFDYQANDQYYRLYEQGIIQFDYTIPFGMELSKAQIELGEVFNEEDYYNKANGQPATPKKGMEYTILNAKDNTWETIDRQADITDNKYVGVNGHILFRVDVRGEQGDYAYAQMMQAPSISIEGSVK